MVLGELDSQEQVLEGSQKPVRDVFVERHATAKGLASYNSRAQHDIVDIVSHHAGHRGDAAEALHEGAFAAFRLVDAMITNFHLPRSSLLMLVAAFAGRDRILAAYTEAVQRRYHFYSYGDAMLIL